MYIVTYTNHQYNYNHNHKTVFWLGSQRCTYTERGRTHPGHQWVDVGGAHTARASAGECRTEVTHNSKARGEGGEGGGRNRVPHLPPGPLCQQLELAQDAAAWRHVRAQQVHVPALGARDARGGRRGLGPPVVSKLLRTDPTPGGVRVAGFREQGSGGIAGQRCPHTESAPLLPNAPPRPASLLLVGEVLLHHPRPPTSQKHHQPPAPSPT